MPLLVVDHQLPFAELEVRLRAAGWRREADPAAPEPLIDGEPEVAEWTGGTAQLHYHFEPATGLRVLRIAGTTADADRDAGIDAAAATLAAALPCRGLDDARALLAAPDVAGRLRGLQMVELQEGFELLDAVAALAEDSNATVAQRARLTGAHLALLASGEALGWLAQWKRENPDQSVVFLLAGSAAARAQVLRWLARTRTASNEAIDAVLRTALADADWEVRLTAIVVAGRLRARAVDDAVAHARLPEDTADGVNQDERRMLRTFQVCALELMRGAGVPAAAREPPTTRERMHAHLLRVIAGAPVDHHDKAFLVLNSLLEPLPDGTRPEALPLPPGVARLGDGFALAGTDIELRWVAPVEHWLGEDLPRMRVPNPIRCAGSSGFFIAAAPLDGGQVLTWDAALSRCRVLSQATGAQVRLPTADEWEMAVRGPDGRRFPWGNNARAPWRLGPSPWGVAGAIGQASEWTSTMHGEEPLVCGGKNMRVCAMRMPANYMLLHALRPVISIGATRNSSQ